jgi:class 3 adenylate cyclase/Tfp pilus assembly protein PilF
MAVNQPDSTRVVAYKEYIWDRFLFSQPDTAFILAEELLAYGLDKNYLKAQALGYHTQGVSYHVRGDYPKALDYYTQSLRIQEQIGDQKGIAACLNNIGLIFVNHGDYPKALENYIQGLKIEEQIGDQKGIAQSLNNIGIIYNNQADYPMALEYYTQSLKIKEEIGDQKGIAASLNNIGLIYQSLGDYPQALDYYTQSLKIKEQIGDQMGIAPSLHNIGNIYEFQGDFPKALDYYNQSLQIKERIGDQIGMAQSLNQIGIVYQNQGNYSDALDYCQRSFELALTVGALELQKSGCICLYDAYKALGNGNKALEYHELLNVIEDSLQAEETAKKLQQMEFQKAMLQDSIVKAEEARLVQEAHTEEVRQKNRTKNVFLGSGVILIFVSLGLWRGLHFVRRSKKQIAYEKEKSDKLLLNILPEEIAEELKRTGEAKPRKYEHVSILFTDFADFTKISEQMSPEELVSEINTCYKTFDRIIEKRGAEKIKTIGDAYMAIDGFGKLSGLAAKNIVLAALDIIDFTTERKKQNEDTGKPAFDIRAGIHTGDVIAGIVGEKKFQFDIWGDAVNTASRMETHSDVGKVNVSQATFELLKDDPQFAFESRGELKVKGKGEMEMWFAKMKTEKK